MVKFKSKARWSRVFLHWEIFDFQFNFSQFAYPDILFLPDSVLVNCMFLRFFSCLLGCLVVGIWLFTIVSYDPLQFYDISCNVSFCAYNFVNMSFFCLFLVSLGKYVNFVCLLKEPALRFFIFSIVFLFSISFICALIFIIFFLFLLLTLKLVCFHFLVP